ncbi:MAG: FHA domain-containing protein [Myxococcales bacterium]
MIVCPRCSKENQDHYKFCLGCGAELPRDAAKKDFSAPTPGTDPPPESNLELAATQQGEASMEPPAPEPAPAPAPAAAPAPAQSAEPAKSGPAPNSCPACGNPVPQDFKFCGTCGHRMDGAEAPAPAPAPEAAPAAAPAAQARGTLVLINPDGSEGSSFSLADGSTQVGRNAGGVFGSDAYLSPDHATFTFSGDGCTVRDDSSLNGVYVKIGRDQPVRLNSGDIFRIGQEIVRFEEIDASGEVDGTEPMGSPNPGYLGRLTLVIGRSSTANSYPIPEDGMHIGRERGDVIFPEDGYVSGLHCRVHHDGSGVVLTDVGSSNGTFVRIHGERKVQNGELLLMGQQLFRLQY